MSDADELYFMDVPEGRAFYPFGYLGRGYIVDAAGAADATRFMRRLPWITWCFWMVLLLVKVFVLHTHDDALVFALGFVGISILYVVMWRIHLRHRPTTATRLRFIDTIHRGAQTFTYGRILFCVVLGAVFTLGSLAALALLYRHPMADLFGGVGLVVGLWILVPWLLIARERSRLVASAAAPGLRQP